MDYSEHNKPWNLIFCIMKSLNINISTNERMDFTWLFSTPIWSHPYIVHDLQLFELDFIPFVYLNNYLICEYEYKIKINMSAI